MSGGEGKGRPGAGVWADAAARREAAALWPEHTGGEREERAALATWTAIAEPGDGVAGRLVAEVGPARALGLLHGEKPFPEAIGAREGEAARARWLPRLRAGVAAEVLHAARRAGLALLTRRDPAWPMPLDDLGDHAPLALWARGNTGLLTRTPSVAIVGARAATRYGEQIAAELAAGLADHGIAVASGAAYGIDGAAHRAVLGIGGPTIAIVAGGADRVYPAGHARLFAEIARSGVILSEVPPGAAPTKWRFLARNRLLAALTAATVVVEAGARSGSLNTAGHAAQLGRPIGAVPGPVTSACSAGCHRLLREYDAICVTCIDDVRELLGADVSSQRDEGGPTSEEIRARDALASRFPRGAEEVARRSGLSLEEAQGALALLELRGEARCGEGGWTLA